MVGGKRKGAKTKQPPRPAAAWPAGAALSLSPPQRRALDPREDA
eukprot:gene4138-13811_t